ncbi:MAG: Hsp20/alpha crystallin family protein [Spirochaetia bacterium]|nr:Hsp20/alpha crystallin family protein [Spirochaetia bacterium]
MTLTTWDPFREMEELVGRYMRTNQRDLAKKSDGNIVTSDWIPAVDIEETKDEFIIKAELPGVKKEDVNVSIENRVLTIKGEKKFEKEEKSNKHHLIEASYGSFVRSFTLPSNIKSDKIDAGYKDGILTLSVPKAEEAKPKQIEVKIQ